MSEFRMPSLGADMESGTLVEWLKKPGDAIHRGDIIAVVETQKGAIEVEIFSDGVMGEPLVPLGAKVPVGAPLVWIEDGKGEKAAAPPRVAPTAPVAPPPMEITGVRASPAARKAAAERGIDLAKVTGTGPGRAITLEDVERAISGAAARPAAAGLDLDKMRVAIAAAMARSKREIPHYYLATDIDMARALAWLEATNASRPPAERLLPAVLTLKAVALAARKHAAFNGAYEARAGFTASAAVHAGVAIAIRGGGLVAPAIHDCDGLALDALMVKLRDLVARARVGRLRSSEFSDPTITVSNLGERGVESLYGVIYPPQVAIVGLGRIARRPVAAGGDVKISPIMVATLAADHRVSDGHAGALFLNEIATLLQEPARL